MLLKPPSKKLTDWLRRCKSRSVKRKERQAAQSDKRFAWQLVRVAVHQKYKGRCARCKRKVYLSSPNPFTLMHAHHIVFRSQGGESSAENALCVCGECHDLIHRHIVDASEFIQ